MSGEKTKPVQGGGEESPSEGEAAPTGSTSQPAPPRAAVPERTSSAGRASAVERSTSPEPSYSEEQVAEILRRTAGLERGRATFRPALSLSEVEQIARDSGLDPALVRVAARSLEERKRETSLAARLAGAPLRHSFERIIDGEIGTEHHERLMGDLRAVAVHGARVPPQISSIGRTLTLSGSIGVGLLEITLTPRGGKTHLRIDVSTGAIAGGLFGGLAAGVGGSLTPMAVALSAANGAPPLVCALAALGALGGSFSLARGIFIWRANAVYKRMEEAADTLEARIKEELLAP